MFCKKCGGKLESYASHCAFCGEPVEKYDATANYIKQENTNSNKEHMTTGKWIGFMFINCIPIVGWLIYLILLFKWAFGSTKDLTLKSYARANLIVMLIAIIFIILAVALNLTILEELMNELENSAGINQ